MRISDWSSDVCSSDLLPARFGKLPRGFRPGETAADDMNAVGTHGLALGIVGKTRQVVLKRWGEEPMRGLLWAALVAGARSDEHTSEIQSLIRNSYAGVCLNKEQLGHIHHR